MFSDLTPDVISSSTAAQRSGCLNTVRLDISSMSGPFSQTRLLHFSSKLSKNGIDNYLRIILISEHIVDGADTSTLILHGDLRSLGMLDNHKSERGE
jgi:hypothetical protein